MPFTTATTHDPQRSPAARRLPALLAAAYALLWAAAAVHPVSRGVWLLENVLPLSLVALLAGMYRRWHLSDASYLCVAVFLALHAAGAHYGYANVPVGAWMRGAFLAVGWGTRNPYDRLVHLAFGLCFVYPAREALRYHVRRAAAAAPLAVAAVLAASAVYEVLEWGAARLVAPATAARFVGMQGDAWDAQQDMALAGLGALVGAALAAAVGRARARARPARSAPKITCEPPAVA